MPDAFENMDRMYRLQRYFYDATRKYYLLGRDRLLNEMDIHPGDHVLEAGCGTARNLIILAKQHPEAHFFGLDASAAMLETARARINSAAVKNITLQRALADDFSFEMTFDLHRPFNRIFFSYSISMIPSWIEAIENALENLKPGGTLSIVDFHDQGDLPSIFRNLLGWWLKQFHVRYWTGLISHLERLRNDGKFDLTVTTLYRRYSFIAHARKIDPSL